MAGRPAVIEDAQFVADVGIPSQKHDRYISGITDTWPGDDTFSVSFTQLEDVRRYRIKAVRTAMDLWVASSAPALGTIVHPTSANNLVFEVTNVIGTGQVAASEPTWPDVVGETVTDESTAGVDGVTWTARHADSVYLKWVEDAVNEAQAEAWLATVTGSASTDVEYRKAYDAIYTEWIELSKNPDDLSLSRLDFLAIADTWQVFVEAE